MNMDMLKYLMEAGAKLHLQERDGWTAADHLEHNIEKMDESQLAFVSRKVLMGFLDEKELKWIKAAVNGVKARRQSMTFKQAYNARIKILKKCK